MKKKMKTKLSGCFFSLVIMQEKNYEEELVLEKEKTVKILCVTICPASNFENDFTL